MRRPLPTIDPDTAVNRLLLALLLPTLLIQCAEAAPASTSSAPLHLSYSNDLTSSASSASAPNSASSTAPAPASASSSSSPDSPSVAVTVTTPRRHSFSEIVNGYGSIQTDTRTALSLSLPQPVRIAKVLVTPGQRVTAGQLLLQLQADPATRLAYRQARQQLQLAQQALKQTRGLYAQRLATQSQLDVAEKNLADARANLATQRALGGGDTHSQLKAPGDGVIESIAVTTGARVAAGTTLLQLAPTGGLRARIGVEPGDAARLRPDMPVTLTPAFGGAALEGRVAQVANAINSQTRLVDVLVTLPTTSGGTGGLPLGSELQARINSGQTDAWAVPRGAVLSDDKGAYLFQIDRGVAHRVDVNLVQPDGATVGVEGAIKPQQPVVVLGVYELSDGMHVRVQQP